MQTEHLEYEWVLEQPNMWLVLLDFLQDPTLMNYYLATTCSTRNVKKRDRWMEISAGRLLSDTGISSIGDKDVITMCLDNIDSTETYHRCELSPGSIAYKVDMRK